METLDSEGDESFMRTLIVVLIIIVLIAIIVLLFYKPHKDDRNSGVPTVDNKKNKLSSNSKRSSYQPDTYTNDDYETPTKRY